MTEITNPLPEDPSGPSALDEESTTVGGAESMLDGGATGTEEGPGGVPASLVGVDKAGDEVPPPPAAQPGDAGQSTGPADTGDALSPSDTGSPQAGSASRSETAT